MTLRFADLLQDIAFELGLRYNSASDTDIDSTQLKTIKRTINSAYFSVCRTMPDDFIRSTSLNLIPASYSTGTVTVTKGSTTVTGIGTTWTARMQMRQIRVGSDRKVYFIKKVDSTTSLTLLEAYQGSSKTATYKIASWAIPLPSDFLCPLSSRDIINLSNGSNIYLIDKLTFRRVYPYVYSLGTPSYCALDGVTMIGILGQSTLSGTVAVTNGSATVTSSITGLPAESDIGKNIWITGDSIRYMITAASSTTWTVSPVVQRASGSALAYYIEPPPLSLLWLGSAPTEETLIEISYGRKPQELWTDEQLVFLAGDYEEYFKALAIYQVVSKFSTDTIHKQELMLEVQQISASLPKYIDTTPIRSWGRREEGLVINDAVEG